MGHRFRGAVRLLLALSALALLGLALFWPESLGWDFSEEALEAAYRYHSNPPADLCYDFHLQTDSGSTQHGSLTTRGDLFRLEYADGVAWGQDAQGAVWIAASVHEAASFAEPIPPALRAALRTEAIDLTELITEIRGGCLLEEVTRLHFRALGVPGHSLVEQAELWLDSTGRIEKLELRRVSEEGEVVQQRLRLRGSKKVSESFYQAGGYVTSNAPVYDGAVPQQREELLRSLRLHGVLERLP
jgi:hypothetical protein